MFKRDMYKKQIEATKNSAQHVSSITRHTIEMISSIYAPQAAQGGGDGGGSHNHNISHSEHHSATKVKLICPHPTLPWAAFVERINKSTASISTSKVTVWDYSKHMSIFSMSTDEISQRCSTNLASKRKHNRGNDRFFDTGGDDSKMDLPRTPPSSKAQQKQPQHSFTSTNSNSNSMGDFSNLDQISNSSNSTTKKSSTTSTLQPMRVQSRKSEVLNLGSSIRHIQFFDDHTLFWNTGLPIDAVDENNSKIRVLLSIVSGECQLLDDSLTSISAVEPLTSSLMVLGYTNGELKFYDWQSGTKLGAKKAHVREVMDIIPASCSQYLGKLDQNKGITGARFITIGADNDAFLWEYDIMTNNETSLQLVISSCILKMANISVRDNSGTTASFDAQRGLFVTMHISLQYALVFDLLSATFSGQTSILSPCLKLLVPGLGIGSMIVPVIHPAYSDTSLTIWALNKSVPELTLFVAPISSEDDEVKPEEHITHFVPDIFDQSAFYPIYADKSKLKIYTIQIPCFRSDIILCGTNIGLIAIDVSTSKKIKGPRHIPINKTGDEFLVIEGDSVFRTSIYVPEVNPTGPLAMENPTIVYKTSISPNSLKIRCPPQLLVSPSKCYVCLFWSYEQRYEILHIPTLLQQSSSFPPPVDFGSGITDFAWVGCDNTYGVLYFSDNVQHIRSKRFELKGGIKSLKSKVSYFGKSSEEGKSSIPKHLPENKSKINLKILIESKVNTTDKRISSQAAATPKNLGDLNVRGGRSLRLFSGPMLCVGCLPTHSNDRNDGIAYFYSKRVSNDTLKASLYMSVGPPLPIPDLVEWSEDGHLCCICIQKTIYIYESKQPNFTLITRIQLAPNEVGGSIHSAKFIHNVLFCSTNGSIQCVFIKKSNDRDHVPTNTDTFVLSSYISSFSPVVPRHDTLSFIPRTERMCLNYPSILNIFAGSLLLSTVSGFHAVSLAHPVLRIGILISAGQLERAKRWFNSINIRYHENLSQFIENLGYPSVAVSFEGLSVESRIELCLKYKLSKSLEKIVEDFGAVNIRQSDQSEGLYNAVECVGAYLLARGNGELVRRMASECIMVNDGIKREAFFLASMLLVVNPSDARRLIKRIVGTRDKPNSDWSGYAGQYVRDFVLK